MIEIVIKLYCHKMSHISLLSTHTYIYIYYTYTHTCFFTPAHHEELQPATGMVSVVAMSSEAAPPGRAAAAEGAPPLASGSLAWAWESESGNHENLLGPK